MNPDISPRQYEHYANRVLLSPNPNDRRNILLAFSLNGNPILVDLKLFLESCHILGAPGTGKSTLLKTLITQWIKRSAIEPVIRSRPDPDAAFDTGLIVVIDMKWDPALMHHARRLAEAYGRRFRLFLMDAGCHSHVYNPLLNDYGGLTNNHLGNLVHQSFNLNAGQDYGAGFFSESTLEFAKETLRYGLTGKLPSTRSRRLNPRALQTPTPVLSYAELNEAALDIMEWDKSRFKDGDHFRKVISNLADVGPSLNLSPRQFPGHPAFRQRIDLGRAITDREVLYFALNAEIPVVAGHIARSFLYQLKHVVLKWKRNNPTAKYIIPVLTDESQLLIAGNLMGLVDQLRDVGVALTFCHQSTAQLHQSRGSRVESLLADTTAIKVFFSVRDPDAIRRIADASGTVAYHDLSSWDVHCVDYMRGLTDPSWAAAPSLLNREPRVRINQVLAPRMTPEDIIRISREPNQAILMVARKEGQTLLEAAVPVYAPPMQSREDYVACLSASMPQEEGMVYIEDETTVDLDKYLNPPQTKPTNTDTEAVQKKNDEIFSRLRRDDSA